jgi:glycosyltransferase involved in cell wall biosynthesis
MKILVVHPGRQHSHQLARALYEENHLYEYWTGVPAADPKTKGPLYRWLARKSPQATTSLPGNAVRHNYLAPVARRLLRQIYSPARLKEWQHRVLKTFDAWSARQLPDDIAAVICYENSARKTFRAAKQKGITTILDAASFHYEWQDDFYDPVEHPSIHRKINIYKKKEVELADHILAVSELARESYVDAGVPSERVTSVPMGADLSAFSPGKEVLNEESEPFTFLFAGYAGQRKGTDLLLSSSARLAQDGYNHRVQFAGDADDSLFAKTDAPVERLGYLNREELVAAFRRADVLVLPSRHDSFGRVVVEAMVTGLPVLLSEHVGAKEAVTEGETGWVVPAEDADALTGQMRWCIEHPEQVYLMREACVEMARDYSWAAYRERVTDVLVSVIGS